MPHVELLGASIKTTISSFAHPQVWLQGDSFVVVLWPSTTDGRMEDSPCLKDLQMWIQPGFVVNVTYIICRENNQASNG